MAAWRTVTGRCPGELSKNDPDASCKAGFRGFARHGLCRHVSPAPFFDADRPVERLPWGRRPAPRRRAGRRL